VVVVLGYVVWVSEGVSGVFDVNNLLVVNFVGVVRCDVLVVGSVVLLVVLVGWEVVL